MNCIVTAGPTYEELDGVRRLTNFSTGALGAQLANFLADRTHNVELLIGHYSTAQITTKAQRREVFTTSQDLLEKLEQRSREASQPHAVFHAAAVSDFTFGKIWEKEGDGNLKELHFRKIPTRNAHILVELKSAPKIIVRLRDWFPKAMLVGWKYELDGSKNEAIEKGRRQIRENRTDACVVNGGAYGEGYGLVANSQTFHCAGQNELFASLARMFDTFDGNPVSQ